jgi:hypothetical protein
MSAVRRVFAVTEALIRWLTRKTGLYIIDVVIAEYHARELDDLAGMFEPGSRNAVRLRKSADGWRSRAQAIKAGTS